MPVAKRAACAWPTMRARSACRRKPHLLGRRRDAGTVRPAASVTAAVSPMTKMSGWPGTDRSGPTYAAGAVGLGAEPARRGRRHDAGGPDHRAASMRPLSRSTPPRVAFGHPRGGLHLDARGQRRAHIVRQVRRKARQDPRSGFEQHDARRARIDAAEIVREVSRAISAMAPAISTPVAPPPTMTKVSRRRRSSASSAEFGPLEGEQNAAADAGRVLDVFEARRELRPFVMAEIGMGRAGGDHQMVEVDRLGIGAQQLLAADRRRAPPPSAPWRCRCARRICRIGQATSAGDSAAVATW